MFASTHMMHLDALLVFKYIAELKLKVCATGKQVACYGVTEN